MPGLPRAGAEFAQLRRLVELEEEGAELGEAFRAELLRPGRLHFADRLADHADRGGAASGEGHAFGAQVVGIRPALEVVETLELAEEVVEGLFADPQPRGQFGRPRALRSGVLEDAEVRLLYGLEGVLTWTIEGVPADVGPGEALCIRRGAVHRFDNTHDDAKALGS